jgi:excisionase family DNA binding protein
MSGDRMNELRPSAVVHEIAAPATSWDPYLSIKTLSNYSSLSARLLRSFLTASDHPLPHYRVGSRVLVKRSDFDGWIQIFRHEGSDPEAIAERILMSLDARPRVSQSRTA